MANRKSSVFIPPGSIASISRGSEDLEMSTMSFNDWHKLMQSEHERLGGPGAFRLWKWCYVGCRPCRWFDNIDYHKKICKCCLKFSTFKVLGTTALIAILIFIFGYSVLDNEILPGGTVFFLFLLFLTSYLAGYAVMFINLPPMVGNVIMGLIFGNVPRNLLPGRNDLVVEGIAWISECIFLIIAIIRAGLLLDLSRIKNRILFITRLAFFPFFCEFLLVFLCSHYLIKLPWEYAATQGASLGLVSLASLTSIMEKNKQSGYGEDKHLSTVLIASSSLNVLFSLFFYTVCIRYILLREQATVWKLLLYSILEILSGIGVGLICGILIAFFPDKRHSKAAVLRILVTGLGSFALTSILSRYQFMAGGVIGSLIMCVIAANMWEELGWHQHNNPVQYFYTLMYYICQPIVLSLIGFTMNFNHNEARQIGLSISIIFIGLVGREIVCFVSIFDKSYSTTFKEKLFICIAWISKGTFQVILAFSLQPIVHLDPAFPDPEEQKAIEYSERIKRTSVIAILLTTPLVCLILTLFTPKLLKRRLSVTDAPVNSFEEPTTNKRLSVTFNEPQPDNEQPKSSSSP